MILQYHISETYLFSSNTIIVKAESTIRYYEEGKGIVTSTEKAFLKKYGFDKKKAYYKGYDANGHLITKLYFDEKTKKGCVIGYPQDNAFGVVIDAKDSASYQTRKLYIQDKNSLIPQQSLFDNEKSTSWKSYLKKSFNQHEEKKDYKIINKKKKLIRVTVTSKVEIDDEIAEIIAIETKFNYDKLGRLVSKEVHLSPYYYETAGSAYIDYYDILGRISYRDSYLTHGNVQYMFIYDKNKKSPKYVLCLDHNIDTLTLSGCLLKIVK